MKTFRWPVRVYIEDTDAGGIVFYANYLRYLERARTEWLRACGADLGSLRRDHQRQFVVRTVNVVYRVPALLDDELEVSATMLKLRSVSLLLEQNVYRGSECLAEGQVELACVNTESLKPGAIPASLKEAIAGEF